MGTYSPGRHSPAKSVLTMTCPVVNFMIVVLPFAVVRSATALRGRNFCGIDASLAYPPETRMVAGVPFGMSRAATYGIEVEAIGIAHRLPRSLR